MWTGQEKDTSSCPRAAVIISPCTQCVTGNDVLAVQLQCLVSPLSFNHFSNLHQWKCHGNRVK